MTVTSEVKKVTKPGNGLATSFSFSPIVIFNETELQVTLVDALGNETLLVLDTDYTVDATFDGINSTTGNVDYPVSGSPLPSGSSLIIKRVLPLSQTLIDLENQGGYNPQTVEQGFDRLHMIVLDLQEQLDRAVKVDLSSATTPDALIASIEAAEAASTAAAASATAAFDAIDDRFLGNKAADPSVDNDGDALVAGTLYYNTSSNQWRTYDGSAWGQLAGSTSTNNTWTGTNTFNGPIDATTAAVATGDFLLFRDISDSNNTKKVTLADAVTATLLDEDDLVSDSATQAPTQQSVKAYIDAATARELLVSGTATNSAGVNFDFPTGYKAFVLQVKNGTVAAANTDMVIELQRSTVAQSGYFTGHTVTNVTAGGFFAANSTSLQLHRTADLDNDAADQFNCEVLIIDPRNSGISTPYYCNSQVIIGTASPTAVYGNQVFGIVGGGANAGDDDRMVLKGATANFTAEYELWGIK